MHIAARNGVTCETKTGHHDAEFLRLKLQNGKRTLKQLPKRGYFALSLISKSTIRKIKL